MAQALFARGDPKFDTLESAQWQAAQVSITSIANCLGRMIFGMKSGKYLYCLKVNVLCIQVPARTLPSIDTNYIARISSA
jgi:hypothetical protein